MKRAKKPKIIEKIIPSEIVSQAHHILTMKSYSSQFKKQVIRQILGECSECGNVPVKYIIEKHDGAEIIRRYCENHG